jgi:hypothetical protein
MNNFISALLVLLAIPAGIAYLILLFKFFEWLTNKLW